MLKNCYFLCFLILYVHQTLAQNEANIWYFGQNAGLDFNSGVPVPLLDGVLNTNEGCATFSDGNGDLLFYTDGITVYNKNHTVMLNGTGLNGDVSSTHSAIVIPKPNDQNIYYIFTVDEVAEPNGLQYSEVDMTLDGGLGGITTNKNILLFTPTTEKITAIKSSTEDEYWVVSHKWNSNEFITYNVSSLGINTTPVISTVGTFVNSTNLDAGLGQIKISPDGTKIAVARAQGLSEVQLFDFNASTGVISNPITLLDFSTNDENVYGIEFSPNSKVLYVGIVGNAVFQYNLQAGNPTDIINSQLQLTTLPRPYGALQLATDGKIYIAKNSQFYIDVIDNPNIVGLGCNYQYEHLYLNGRRSKLGLPPFIQTFLQIDDIQVENVCFGDTSLFTVNLPTTYDSLVWDFGDGNTSTLENPSHIYVSAGDYTASLTVTVGGNSSTDTKALTIFEQPTATQPQDNLECDTNNDGFFEFDLTSQDVAILNGQSATTFEVAYFASMVDYTNNTPIANPTTYTNAVAYTTENIIASVRNRNNGACEAFTDFNIQVFDMPTPNLTVPPLTDCDNVSYGTDTDGIILIDLTDNESIILNGQSATDFTVNYYTDVALSNQIATPSNYQNTNSTETIYVQVVNNNKTNCTAETSFTLEVFELPIVTSIVTLSQCDDDVDGYTAFNLNEAIDEITANAVNETISFYESQFDAENTNSPITNPSAYINENVSTDTIWARVENSNGCFRTAQINLLVSTTQIPITFTRDFYACDDTIDGDSTNGISSFNLSSVTTEIEALFPVGQQLIISYYSNLADALAENNPIVNITDYRNISSPVTQEIFIRVDSTLDNDCLGLGQHITLHVEMVPVANPVSISEQCDDDGDGMYAFDTTNMESTLLNGQTNVIVAYTDETGTSLPSPLPNPFNTAAQTITARVTNATSQDPDGACFDETTIDFYVSAAAVANPVPDVKVCDDNNDGQYAFDTSTFEATILNGQTGMQVIYTDENGNALQSPLPNPFISETQTITVRVENSLSSACYDETTVNLIVFEQPIAHDIQDDFVCDVDADGSHNFIITDYNLQILNGQSDAIFEVNYFDVLANAENNVSALPINYVSTSTSETIYARIHNRNNTDCYAITTFQIGVSYLPIAYQPEDMNVCDDDNNDGIAEFNLSNQNIAILNGQSETENRISFHLSQIDANDNLNAISPNFTNSEIPQTIYVRLENSNNSQCYSTTSFNIVVVEKPVLLMDDQWPICEGDTVEIIADAGFDEYLWSTGETTQSIIVDATGVYEVIATNIYGNLRCEDSMTVSVVQSDEAIITNLETVDWSQSNNEIIVSVSGNGDYEYSIDGFYFQDSNHFTNLYAGEYTVYVNDKNGCGVVMQEVYLLYYPKLFTPNNDGYNDYWKLYGSNNEPDNIIYIYDRYGKLLKQLSPTDIGWNGTFNGNNLPSSDYWFLLERQNGKQYRGHFTLKR